jgi:hypothetical protein
VKSNDECVKTLQVVQRMFRLTLSSDTKCAKEAIDTAHKMPCYSAMHV